MIIRQKLSLLSIFIALWTISTAQNVPILDYQVNNFGQVELEIQGQADQYYLLTALHEPNLNYESVTSMTLGQDGLMTISEPAGAYALQNYKVTAHSIASPDDADGDGIDDITEFNNLPTDAPLNFAEAIDFIDGSTSIDSYETFANLSVVQDVPWAPFLNGTQFVKFGILDRDTDFPKVYFINSNTYNIHANFFFGINAVVNGDDGSGEIVYNPNEILPNGAIGSYSFNFSFGEALSFEDTQRTYELLIANMPYLKNNMQHFIGSQYESQYLTLHEEDYDGSRINVVLESDVFADVDFLPFNQAEGYGFFKQMTLDENPGSRDIVLYDALPNSLPRVGGIITSVIQTPLSHVNLRAIQDNVPNAYIKEPLMIDSIANLLGKYIYYKVDDEKYEIREATLEEVNDWYENIRPTEEQIPDRDLSQTLILPLDEIEFEMSTAFGAKCSNVATMRKFGFPEGTIPNGFGVPFYYYDEFMKFNGFYQQAEDMITDPTFISDLQTRIDMLDDFRKEIRAAAMPQWMLDSLNVMHESFPEGTAVRCRSSTNNEDLPGFSGAGLYTSKTQHLDEGHISKSIKQVYASMWNFRAFDERDFYRVDHFIAAMGVLCHPNFQEEKSNGVGVSIDPIYQTQNTFYLNTQVGEALITNPNPNEIPEEILLYEDPAEGYFVLRYSNLVPQEELVMNEGYLDLMRDYLKIIHDEFAILYDVVGAEGFGMDIEYKVTAEDQLIIKQARPWVSFWAEINSNFDLAVTDIIQPESSASLGDSELVTTRIANQGLRDMKDFDISLLVEGQVVETITITDELSPFSEGEYQFTVPQDLSTIGDYNIGVSVAHPSDGYSNNDTLETVISNLHLLEGGLVTALKSARCGAEIEVFAIVTNYGESTFNNTEIEVVVNGMIVDTINYDFSIPYLAEVDITISVTENLEPADNEILLNLLSVNGQPDAVPTNNSSSINTSLDSAFDYVTLLINADEYPDESSWVVYDDSGEITASGSLSDGDIEVIVNICVDYASCYTLFFYDSFGDGICCGYGQGNFSVYTSAGDLLLFNDGDFGNVAVENFCPNDNCMLTAEITTVKTTNQNTSDGSILINPVDGTFPYEYSIDGGNTFSNDPLFSDLPVGEYMVVVRDATEICIYEEMVEVEPEIMVSVNDLSVGDFKLYPNPTTEILFISLEDQNNTKSNIQIELYNSLGKLIHTSGMTKNNGILNAQISLAGNPAGTYFVNCYSEEFKKTFKVIKIE